MSIGRHNPNAIIPPEVYAANRAKIEQAKALVNAWDAMNEEGLQNHEEMARQLEAKVREGEEARRLLESLKKQSVTRPAITQGNVDSSLVESNTSRIEEVQYDPPAAHTSQLSYSQPQQQPYYGSSRKAEPTYTYEQKPVATPQANPPTSSPQPAGAWNAPLSNMQQNAFHGTGSLQQHIQPLQQVSAQSAQRQSYSTGFNAPTPAQNPNVQHHTSANSHQVQSSRQSNSFPSATSQAAYESTFLVNQSNLGSTSQGRTTHLQANNLPQSSTRGMGSTVSTSKPLGPMSSHNSHSQPANSAPPTKRAPTVLEVYQLKNVIQSWTQQAPPNSFFQVYDQFVLYKSPSSVLTIRFTGAGNVVKEITVEEFISHLLRVASQAEGMNQGVLQPPKPIPSIPSSSQITHRFPSKPPPQVPTSKPQPPKPISSNPTPSRINRQLPSKPRAPPAPQATHGTVFISHVPPTPDDSKASTSTAQDRAQANHGTVFIPHVPPTSDDRKVSTSAAQDRAQPPASQPGASSLSTPGKQSSVTMIGSSPRSTTQANKKSLARDIMYALGKRPRESPTSVIEFNEPQTKRQATELAAVGTSQASTQQPHTTEQVPIIQQQAPAPLELLSDPNIQPISQTTSQTTTLSGQSVQPIKSINSVSGPEPVNPTSTASVRGSVSESPKETELQPPPPVEQQSEAALPPIWSPSIATSSLTPVPGIPSTSTPLASSISHELLPTTAPLVSEPQIADHPRTIMSLNEPKSPIPVSSSITATGNQLLPVNRTSASPIDGPSTPPTQTPSAVPKPTVPSGQRVNAGLISTSFQPSPSKQSCFDPKPMKKPEPLFLPSTSPELESESFDIHALRKDKEGIVAVDELDNVRTKRSFGISKGKQRAYVLVPPPPDYLVKYRQQQAARAKRDALPPLQQRQREGTGTLSVSMSVAGEQAFFYPSDSQRGSPDDVLEREVFRLACSRLQGRPCRWDGCGVIMNSIDSLIRHLNKHHKPPLNINRSHQYFMCKWTQCGRRINTKEKHLEGHAFLPLGCPYQACEESYRTASQLFKHVQAKHDGGIPKPSALPAPIGYLEEPSDLPHPVPAYLVVTTSILPESISKGRHEELGPWVIRNIAGLEEDRPIKQRSRKVTKSTNNDDIPDKEPTKAYEFLNARSTRYSTYLSMPADKMHFGNLPSAKISRMVDEGLTLWSKESDEDDEDGDELSTQLPVKMDGWESEVDQNDSDEDVVENMLTEAT